MLVKIISEKIGTDRCVVETVNTLDDFMRLRDDLGCPEMTIKDRVDYASRATDVDLLIHVP